MPFCTKCGRQIFEGEVCTCEMNQGSVNNAQIQNPTIYPNHQVHNQQLNNQRMTNTQQMNSQRMNTQQINNQQYVRSNQNQNYQQGYGQNLGSETGKYVKFAAGEISGAVVDNVNSWKAELKNMDAYERGKKIVPDIIKANDGEVSIKQYDRIAKLRSRSKLAWAEGKMQLTNKRLIFRAAGRSLLSGKQFLQHEFAVEEIAGVEMKRDHRFNFFDLILAMIILCFGVGAVSAIFMALYAQLRVVSVILGLVVGVALLIPIFAIKRYRPYLKLLCFSGTVGAFSPMFIALQNARGFGEVLFVLFGVIILVGFITLIMKIAFQPNLKIAIRTKIGKETIEIRHRKAFIGSTEYTGYDEVLPDVDTDKAVRELGALISDIQKFGDLAIEKWR